MALCIRSAGIRAARPGGANVRPRARVVVRAAPAKPETTQVEKAIKEAEAACAEGTTEDCAVAWDNVEEVSAALSHKKDAAGPTDPLEKFCETAPDADECRVYED